MAGAFFLDCWPRTSALPNSVRGLVGERGHQLFPSTTDRFLIHPGDLEQQPIGSMAEPLQFHGQIPAALLLVEPAQQQVHLAVVLTLMLEARPTRGTPARWHNFCGHLSFHLPDQSFDARTLR
jgi:hypothetical protein